MQEREARVLYTKGALQSAEIQRTENNSGWIVRLLSNDPAAEERILASKRNKDVRLFKTTDAALRWCENMGFGKVQVNLSDAC